MDEKRYRAKIAQSKAGLEKDTTPATADMLSRMRTEMHEFSVPFFQKAVKDELKEIRARQKVLLDKIIALDAGKLTSELPDDAASGGDDAKDAAIDDGSDDAKEETKPAEPK